MQISIDQAKAFCSVVEQGGYSQASSLLLKSHSAIIYLVQGLEEQCGFPLFDRRHYRNTLTERGQRVYQKCQEILSKVDELEVLCSQIESGWEPSLIIVLDAIIPFLPFLNIYKKFRTEKIPTVVQTHIDYLDDVEKTYEKQDAHLMISIVPNKGSQSELARLKPFRSLLVAHRDHPIHLHHRRWSLQDLEQFDFLTVRGLHAKLSSNTREFEEKASYFLSDFYTKKMAILGKAGFGWLPEHMIATELKRKSLLPIKWERESTQLISPVVYGHRKKTAGPAVQLILNSLGPLLG